MALPPSREKKIGNLQQEPRTGLLAAARAGAAATVAIPGLGLGTKMPIGLIVGRLQHGPIRVRLAELRLRLIELFVTIVQQIDFRIMKRRIRMRIALPIQIA